MKKHEDSLDAQLDRAIERIRDDSPDPDTVDEAATRVWDRLGREMGSAAATGAEIVSIRSCTDYQGLIASYLKGDLSDARALLLEDHTRECIPCRRALHAARSERLGGGATTEVAPVHRASGRSFPYRWAAAAVFLLVAVLAAWQFVNRESGGELRIASVDGTIYQVSQDGPRAVEAGTVLTGGERIRTAKGSAAVVELADGSRVELNQRSEIRVTERSDDATVNLARGSIIVEASDQGSGHLFVRTDDCLVAVTGTVFSVVHGNRGSRISVIEGEVQVDYAEGADLLLPGQQLRTSPFLGPLPIAEEIAWSRNLDDHLALLREFSEFQRELTDLPMPGLRHSTELLDRAPEGTIIYIGLPNLSETLGEAHRLFREKVESSPILQQWWEDNVVATGAEPELTEAIEKVRLFGEQLGDEIVVTLQKGAGPEPVGPVLLAELKDPGQFRTLLNEEIERLAGELPHRRPPLRIIDNPFAQLGADRDDDLLLFIQGRLLVAAPKIADLQHVASLAGTPGSSRFVGSPFHDALARTYRDGVSIVFGADMEAIFGLETPPDAAETLEALGILDLRHLIVERHDADDRTVTRASLTFEEARKGVASWLAEPAPMGTLEFISADATAAGAFVVKTPSALLEELFSAIGKTDDEFVAEMDRLKSEQGIDIVEDIAGPLGGEIAFALDGPVLPRPAWKLVMEVYDQPGLQRAIEWAVEQANEMASQEGYGLELRLNREEVRGRVYYALEIGDTGEGLHYAFIDGYLVAVPERGLLDRAIQYRNSGYTLPTSPGFASLLPDDGRAHFSAIVYQNVGAVLDPFLQSRIAQSAPLTDQQRKAIDDLAGDSRPSLFYAYAEPERIVLGGTDHAGLLGTSLGSGFQLGSILGLQDALRHAAESPDAVYDDPDF